MKPIDPRQLTFDQLEKPPEERNESSQAFIDIVTQYINNQITVQEARRLAGWECEHGQKPKTCFRCIVEARGSDERHS